MSEPAPLSPSTLYLVATPIGNLEDITLRALRVLKQCHLIAAEDTRRTVQLLRHFEITKPVISCHGFNEAKRASRILDELARGASVALVSDAGSPGISDPGERLVRAARAAGFRVEPVPGACALIAGLTASGLDTSEFHFAGFLPHKSGQRQRLLSKLTTQRGTLVLYESPYRIEKLLNELLVSLPETRVVLGRELTKKFEEFLSGTPTELIAHFKKHPAKGEFVVMLENPTLDAHSSAPFQEGDTSPEVASDTGPEDDFDVPQKQTDPDDDSSNQRSGEAR